MKILGIETASGRCSVAITDGRDVFASEIITTYSMQAEKLIGLIKSVCDKAHISLDELDYLAVTNGPGSFTGIRIGLATILGISIAKNITPIVVSNFSIINYRIREQFRNFDYACAIIDAYRDEYYFQIFDKKNVALEEAVLIKLPQIIEKIEGLKGTIVCAGACSKLAMQENIISKNNINLLPRFPNPDARIVSKLAYTQILKENFSTQIEPLYIRLPDAKLPFL